MYPLLNIVPDTSLLSCHLYLPRTIRRIQVLKKIPSEGYVRKLRSQELETMQPSLSIAVDASPKVTERI